MPYGFKIVRMRPVAANKYPSECATKININALENSGSQMCDFASFVFTFIVCVLQLIYLRQFKQLRSLNLQGNPICRHEDYKIYTSALLRHTLVYLDYFLLDTDSVRDLSINSCHSTKQ